MAPWPPSPSMTPFAAPTPTPAAAPDIGATACPTCSQLFGIPEQLQRACKLTCATTTEEFSAVANRIVRAKPMLSAKYPRPPSPRCPAGPVLGGAASCRALADGPRKPRDFALDAAARERHSAPRKVGPVGRHNPTGTTNRL